VGAQQLVREISVTVLDIDELKTDVVRAPRRRNEIDGQAIDLVVGEHPDPAREATVEQRMGACRERLRMIVQVWPGETA
jgi:hypothetical protein